MRQGTAQGAVRIEIGYHILAMTRFMSLFPRTRALNLQYNLDYYRCSGLCVGSISDEAFSTFFVALERCQMKRSAPMF
jgi:hypothetical protein